MKKSTKITITFLLFLLVQTFVTVCSVKLSAEASVKFAYTNGIAHIPVLAVDHCSKFAIKKGKQYIEFCNYNFFPLDNKSTEYYIILLEDTYFATTNSEAYTTVLKAIRNNQYDSFFNTMMKGFIMKGLYGDWNELGYLENNVIFGWTFVPNKNMLMYCSKNKKNRYSFETEWESE